MFCYLRQYLTKLIMHLVLASVDARAYQVGILNYFK